MKNKLLLLALLMAMLSPIESISEINEPVASYNVFLSKLKLPNKLQFCGEDVPLDDPEIKERAEREFYNIMQSPGVMIIYMKRSGRYFPVIERKLKENNLPDDLKYITVAESGLLTNVKSPKGATSYWQFMQGTAQSHGLTVDEQVDERRSIEKSTDAAIKYLKSGFRTHGSWVLTAAGYNMGNSGLNNTKDYQNVDNYFDLFLNEETSRYIFRIAIYKEIMSNPKMYGFDIPKCELYSEYKTESVKVSDSVPDLAAWAKANGTTYKDVKMLNPWILKRQLPKPSKGGMWEIAVPATKDCQTKK